MSGFEFIETTITGNIAVIELNRPRQLNSLNRKMVSEIVAAMERFDREETFVLSCLLEKAVHFQPEPTLMK